jgi:ferritin-like metal-binding protein YciE
VLLKYQDYVIEHIERLDKFIEEEEITSLSTMNRIMHAFADEIREKMTHCRDYEVKDACLLAGIQAINHFKISAYGTAAAFANTLGMQRTAGLFHEAEVNEKQIDDRLSQLAEFEVNKRATAPIALEE